MEGTDDTFPQTHVVSGFALSLNAVSAFEALFDGVHSHSQSGRVETLKIIYDTSILTFHKALSVHSIEHHISSIEGQLR